MNSKKGDHENMGKKGLSCLTKPEREVVESFVKELREKLDKEIVSMKLFGSKVRGNSKKDSDIDIFILVEEKTLKTSEIIDDLTADYIFNYNLPISPVLYDLFEYRKNKELGSFFFESVEKEGVVL
jgi:predicted nucleotidyltransferase